LTIRVYVKRDARIIVEGAWHLEMEVSADSIKWCAASSVLCHFGPWSLRSTKAVGYSVVTQARKWTSGDPSGLVRN